MVQFYNVLKNDKTIKMENSLAFAKGHVWEDGYKYGNVAGGGVRL